MADNTTRFSIRLSAEPLFAVLAVGSKNKTSKKLKFRGSVPFSGEDFGVAKLDCQVRMEPVDRPSYFATGDYLMIANRKPGEFFERHMTHEMLGRLLLRSNLEPWTDEEYGELGPPVELWMKLSDDNWNNLVGMLGAIQTTNGVNVQFDVECRTCHQEGTMYGLQKRKLLASVDEEYPVIGVDITMAAKA